jgi:sugar lactone lactonase YvrE
MKRFKAVYLLSVAIITVTFISCKKDKKGNEISTEKKVMVSTVAGDGVDGFANGAALSARFDAPVDVVIAADGSIYVADYNNHRIRKISAGQVTSFAGSGTYGIVNGNGQSAQFKDPYRVAIDGGGNIYMLDQVDPRIRKISAAADVTTYAGTDQAGFQNGDALLAQFQVNAEGIAADAQGNVYMGDTFNERIRKISTTGQVSTQAGNGTEGLTDGDIATAQFRFPDGVAIDGQGNIYVADGGNFCIRKVTPAGVVSRFAGSGTRGTSDGNATDAQFYEMIDIVADSHGNLFVIDDNRIRKITPQGVVSTIAGSTVGYADGEGSIAKFKDPLGLGIDAQDNIYVADANNNRIRKISFQ